MKIEDYRDQFSLWCMDVKQVDPRLFTPEEYQRQLSQFSATATRFYSQHASVTEPDYQAKIQIFLDFDELLKSLKRSASLVKAHRSNSFGMFDHRPEDDEKPQTKSLLKSRSFW